MDNFILHSLRRMQIYPFGWEGFVKHCVHISDKFNRFFSWHLFAGGTRKREEMWRILVLMRKKSCWIRTGVKLNRHIIWLSFRLFIVSYKIRGTNSTHSISFPQMVFPFSSTPFPSPRGPWFTCSLVSSSLASL